jgi:hypothetical protein
MEISGDVRELIAARWPHLVAEINCRGKLILLSASNAFQ